VPPALKPAANLILMNVPYLARIREYSHILQ
jgi:hypothetical protein